MGVARISLGVFGLATILLGTLTVAGIWLLFTDPVTVADAMNQGEVSPLARALATVLFEALNNLLKYL